MKREGRGLLKIILVLEWGNWMYVAVVQMQS